MLKLSVHHGLSWPIKTSPVRYRTVHPGPMVPPARYSSLVRNGPPWPHRRPDRGGANRRGAAIWAHGTSPTRGTSQKDCMVCVLSTVFLCILRLLMSSPQRVFLATGTGWDPPLPPAGATGLPVYRFGGRTGRGGFRFTGRSVSIRPRFGTTKSIFIGRLQTNRRSSPPKLVGRELHRADLKIGRGRCAQKRP